ncbi:DUF4380 domain-containing protein [Niveibacterium sp. SC-1]|uniref:DUF4380 domain-containing protein n=1 Tax=Niveibacterium sp. SC-1 TaxID=3135646 RepID=UPI00311F700A
MNARLAHSDLLVLEHDGLRVRIDPGRGGRIVSFARNGQELLTQEAVHPNNYGSTFWDSPQSAWGWPPRASLDSEPYVATELGGALLLESARDESGLRFSKRFALNAALGALEIEFRIANEGLDALSCGPWEITRVPGGLSFFPHATHANLPASALEPVQYAGGICWYEFDPTLLAQGKKLFSGASEPWLAHLSRDGLLFVKVFPAVPATQVPPGQGEVEIWGQDGAIYIELETHGAYRRLAPGESFSYPVRWFLEQVPAEVDSRTGSAELLALARAIATR